MEAGSTRIGNGVAIRRPAASFCCACALSRTPCAQAGGRVQHAAHAGLAPVAPALPVVPLRTPRTVLRRVRTVTKRPAARAGLHPCRTSDVSDAPSAAVQMFALLTAVFQKVCTPPHLTFRSERAAACPCRAKPPAAAACAAACVLRAGAPRPHAACVRPPSHPCRCVGSSTARPPPPRSRARAARRRRPASSTKQYDL